MRTKNQGVALSEYAIIIGVVCVVLIPVLIVLGSSLWSALQEYSNVFGSNSENNVSKQLTPDVNYDFTKTESTNQTKPTVISTCQNGTCEVDLGVYGLTDIPENVAELVETSGVSGATDKLMPLLEQLANQMESQGFVEPSQEMKDMANLGYFIAGVNKVFEQKAASCEKQRDPQSCMSDFFKQRTSFPLPDNLKNVLPSYGEDLRDNYSLMTYSLDLNYAYVDPDYYKNYSDGEAAMAFVAKYREIQKNPAYPESVKAVVEKIYRTIYDLNFESHLNLLSLSQEYNGSMDYYDAVTGKLIKEVRTPSQVDMAAVINPVTSVGTEFGSTVVCKEGKNKSKDQKCE